MESIRPSRFLLSHNLRAGPPLVSIIVIIILKVSIILIIFIVAIIIFMVKLLIIISMVALLIIIFMVALLILMAGLIVSLTLE